MLFDTLATAGGKFVAPCNFLKVRTEKADVDKVKKKPMMSTPKTFRTYVENHKHVKRRKKTM